MLDRMIVRGIWGGRMRGWGLLKLSRLMMLPWDGRVLVRGVWGGRMRGWGLSGVLIRIVRGRA